MSTPSSNTKTTQVPPASPKATEDAEQPRVNVPEDCIFTLVLKMQLFYDGMHPTEPKKTRTTLMLAMWERVIETQTTEICASMHEKRWKDTPFFLVPMAHVSGFHYARFVVSFIREFFNPNREYCYNDDIDDDDDTDTSSPNIKLIPCTMEEQRARFTWLHERSDKLLLLARAVARDWDGRDVKMVHDAVMAAYDKTYAAWDLALLDMVIHFCQKHLKIEVRNQKELEDVNNGPHGEAISDFTLSLSRPLLSGDMIGIKRLAQTINASLGVMYMLSIDYQVMAHDARARAKARLELLQAEKKKKMEASEKKA